MESFKHFIGKNVVVEISGKKIIIGRFIDVGTDIIVIYNGQYLYIPICHIHSLKLDTSDSFVLDDSFQLEQPMFSNVETISVRKVLLNAKGKFVQIFISGDKSIHGYLTSIMNDYFVFYSPAFKVMFISMNHLKWLIPYKENTVPFSLDNQFLPVNPTSISLARSFSEQCKKLENTIIILDGGDHPEKIGLLKKVQDNQITLINANNEQVYWNLLHLKTIQLP